MTSLALSSPHLVEPELHVLGEVSGASLRCMGGGFGGGWGRALLLSFGGRGDNAFAGFEVKKGKDWKCVGGREQGQTQVDYPEDGRTVVWNHPIDLHYYTASLSGWPQLVLEVGSLDFYGGKHLIGYGFCYLPSSSGIHDIDVEIWRPVGSPLEEVADFHVGGGPSLLDADIIHQVNKAKEDRCHLYTQSQGTVRLHLEVTLRNFHVHKLRTQ